MRTSRCILYTAVVTVLSLFYVFQQTEIVKLGYKITRAENVLESMRDRRTSLEFTLTSLESPLNLDKNLLMNGNNQYEMAQSFKLVRMTPPRAQGVRVAAGTREGFAPLSFLRRLARQSIFAPGQAEAKTVK
jgi:hypothetical protein